MSERLLLHARGLCKQLGGRTVVADVELQLRAGEVLGLLGPNGAGKSTIFRMLMGLEPADQGEIWFDGLRVDRLPTHQRARRGLGYLSQNPCVIRGMTVRDNLRLALELSGQPGEADVMLERFGLQHLAHSRASRLSGGERRRLELARLFLSRPRLALLDEPLKGLDRDAVQLVARQVRELSQQGVGVLVTDHAVNTTLAMCGRAVVLECGRVVADGTPQQLQELGLMLDPVSELHTDNPAAARDETMERPSALA